MWGLCQDLTSNAEVHFRHAVAAGHRRRRAVASDHRVLAQHGAYFCAERAGAFAVVDANAYLAVLDRVVDRLGHLHQGLVDDHPVEVDLAELTGVGPHGRRAAVGALAAPCGRLAVGHQCTSSTTVTPSPPSRGSAEAWAWTSACLRSMSRTARRRVPVPLPWMMRISVTPERAASSSRWSMSVRASSTVRPRRSSSRLEADGINETGSR